MKLQQFVQFVDHPLLNCIALKAAINNNFEVVKFCIKLGADNFDMLIVHFAGHSNLEAINFLIEKGANDFNGVMNFAALYGDMNIVKLAIEKGANDFEEAMNMAKTSPNKKMWKFLKQQRDKQKKQP